MRAATLDSPNGKAAARNRVALDVWSFGLDPPDGVLTDLSEALSGDELERAESFRFRRDAERFAAGRGRLRRILAGLLDNDPAALRFTYGPAGKPALKGYPKLGFNLAHSGGLALLAVAEGATVGVDVELSPPDRGACEEISPAYFSAEEVESLAALGGAQREAAFLRCWTRKEAYVKALGDGLQVPLDGFSVSLGPGEPARLRSCRKAGEVERWTLADLSCMTAGATAAVCLDRPILTTRLHRQARW